MALETDLQYQRRDLAGNVTATYAGVVGLRTALLGGSTGTSQGGEGTGDTCRYHLQASTLPVRPRENDRIVSATEGTWEIVKASVKTLLTRHECECVKVS